MKRKHIELDITNLEDKDRTDFMEIAQRQLLEMEFTREELSEEKITESLNSFYDSMSGDHKDTWVSSRGNRVMTEVTMVFSALRKSNPENDAAEQLIEILSTCANKPADSDFVLSSDELTALLIRNRFVNNFSSLVELYRTGDIFVGINPDRILRLSGSENLGPEKFSQIIKLVTDYSEIFENISPDIIAEYLKSKDTDYLFSSVESIESIKNDIDSYVELELDKLRNIVPNRTMGVEIEFCHQGDNPPALTNGWQAVVDKSVEPNTYDDEQYYDDGIEYISPILENITQGLDPLIDQLRSISHSTAYTNSSCGLHIHIGVTNVEDTNEERLNFIKQITINYLALEMGGLAFPKRDYEIKSLLADISDDSGREAGIASKVEKIKNSENIEELMQILNLIDDKADRAVAPVNLFSLMKHGTLEFRAHPGTVNPKDIVSWTRCINDLVGLSQDMIKEGDPKYPNLEDVQKIVRDLQSGNGRVIKTNESSGLISSSPTKFSAATYLTREKASLKGENGL